DELAGAAAIDPGALERQIDEAINLSVFPDWDLAQQEWRIARFLQHSENVAQRACRLVDFVEEQEMRDFQIGEPLKIRAQQLHLGRLGLADDNRGINARKQIQCLLEELDGTRAIEKRETLVDKPRSRAIDFDAHLSGARLGA